MTMKVGVCVPTFAGANDSHPRMPLAERFDARQMAAAVREDSDAP